MHLHRIRHRWNLLDYSGEMRINGHPVYYDSHERTETIDSMRELLETGESSYENPFGEDDTEILLDAFAELNKKQQRAFLAVAKTCIKDGTPLGDEHLTQVLRAK